MPSETKRRKEKKLRLIYLPVRKAKGKTTGEGRKWEVPKNLDEKMEKDPQSDDNKSGAVTHTHSDTSLVFFLPKSPSLLYMLFLFLL